MQGGQTAADGRVDVLSSQPHYGNHLAPIWFGLPEDRRGTWWAAGICADRGNVEGVTGWRRGYPPEQQRPVLVAGYIDEMALAAPSIYLEHGAGQTYRGDGGNRNAAEHESYSGSGGHDRCVLFLCPNETVAARWRNRYQDTPTAVIGCPKLDWWHAHPSAGGGGPLPAVAVTFHADNRLIPEATSALEHYTAGLAEAVAELRQDGWEVLGHGHPRLWQRLRTIWGSLNVEAVEDFGQVLSRADVLCVDNSSVGPEFASTGRPVVWMNAPHFRRDVNHGGRFWDWVDGAITVEDATGLPRACRRALRREPADERARERMVGEVYCAADGHATRRAVDAILRVVDGRR